MSEIRSIYPPDHEVFKGGRYLEAFACLEDIDHYELSILQYLGNKMPFDKGFVGEVAFPSVATISHNTKIPESTVRKKVKQLVQKGYIIKKERRMMNERGRWQQSSNDYFLTNLAFEKFESVKESKYQIASERRRAVGQSEIHQSSPITRNSPPPKVVEGGVYTCDSEPLRVVATNSPSKSPDENPHSVLSSSLRRTPEIRKQEAFRLIVNWEELLNKTVSTFEKRRFLQEYFRSRSNEPHLLEKILEIKADPYLAERAKSINFLFSGYDMALKNKVEIERTLEKTLSNARTSEDIDIIESQLPGFVCDSSRNFASPSKDVLGELFGHFFDKAKDRVSRQNEPKDLESLSADIKSRLSKDPLPALEQKLKTLLEIAPTVGYTEALKIYRNCLKTREVVHD